MIPWRMPAEWEPHAATLLTWPHDATIWEDLHGAAERAFAELAAALSLVEDVHLVVEDAQAHARAEAELEDLETHPARLHFHRLPSNDVWTRDHGPISRLAPDGHVGLLNFRFNAWGGKFPHEADAALGERLAERLGFPYARSPLTLEGGAIEVNGAGDLITTEAVALTGTRNPDWSRDDLERELASQLGVERIHWLGKGLTGDDTDGHIDDMVRFSDARTLLVVDPPPGHPDHDTMQENLERLRQARGPGGAPFTLVSLPTPEPLLHAGELVPASYANFYIANGMVLVPTFRQPADERALAILQEAFPRHRVRGLDATALITQSGALHCVTQQLAAPGASR